MQHLRVRWRVHICERYKTNTTIIAHVSAIVVVVVDRRPRWRTGHHTIGIMARKFAYCDARVREHYRLFVLEQRGSAPQEMRSAMYCSLCYYTRNLTESAYKAPCSCIGISGWAPFGGMEDGIEFRTLCHFVSLEYNTMNIIIENNDIQVISNNTDSLIFVQNMLKFVTTIKANMKSYFFSEWIPNMSIKK